MRVAAFVNWPGRLQPRIVNEPLDMVAQIIFVHGKPVPTGPAALSMLPLTNSAHKSGEHT
jgi:hypothetical protein